MFQTQAFLVRLRPADPASAPRIFSSVRSTMPVLALVFTLIATAAPAQDLPALYDVTGVAQDDVLNVRTAPSSDAPVIGTLSPGENGVEIVRTNPASTWAQLNIEGRQGWASLNFLARRRGSALPEAPWLRCFGTEPFWSLDAAQTGRATFRTPEETLSLSAGTIDAAQGQTRPFVLRTEATDLSATVVIRPGECSDGMSDNRYGLSAALLFQGSRDNFLAGCCSLETR
ncbi:SH3 domain-containing protein [Allosediminivita pacifica]|uniref:SH3 domain-containing protein n=2 Tax=Allosediminivita pacifica TaxID=1267769 RepID=A0A2T6B469_9RHOB|nr:SH3 domain-containing protein [Allosediminivita pacifica]